MPARPPYKIMHRVIRLREGADGTTWPWPFGEHQDAAWKARYAPGTLTRDDLFELAEIANAYSTLITHPAKGVRTTMHDLHRIWDYESRKGVIAEDEVAYPSDRCLLCRGEACNLCDTGPGRPRCEHAVDERHQVRNAASA